MVYYGEYEVSLTAGGRVALPKKIREGFGNNEFVITKGLGKCLSGYDKISWEGRIKELLNMPVSEKESLANIEKRRILVSSTVYLEIDDQGRAVLPKNLRKLAALSKKAVIAGIGEHFEIWDTNKWFPVDGVIFDLGLSMEQLSKSKKGFSYRNDEEALDMRISGSGITAADVLNTFSEEELEEFIPKYSEEITAVKIVKKIVAIRRNHPIAKVLDLKKVIESVINRSSYHVYARIFQALRIIVNDEINNLGNGLRGAFEIIGQGGKIVVITFHSIEDREVKRIVATLKNVLETRIDVKRQRKLAPYEKSARLRVIQKQ